MSDAVDAVGGGSFAMVCLHTQVRILAGGPAGYIVRPGRVYEGETHPNPLLQTERVEQSRKFDIKLLRR
jgi:hypothetical protein